jgi:hypothetical protein
MYGWGNGARSYNLLTGDYIITYDMYTPTEREIIYKGNRVMGAVFIEDINGELLSQLDLILRQENF